MFRVLATAFLALAISAARPAVAQAPASDAGFVLPAPVWEAYRSRFVDASGRVVDTSNGGISHSEGQGYGLLLALMAGDQATFEQIWSFTLTELLIRDDGLAAWKWDPAAQPHVTDVNNATDGDILIAWALARAGEAWHRPLYSDAARRIARAIATVAVKRVADRTVLMPGAAGFGNAKPGPDGVVLNLSYWIYPAFDTLARLAPSADWPAVTRSGLSLTGAAQFGQVRLPTDWISLPSGRPPEPAPGFPPEFGYNAVRIPLYLLGGGNEDRSLLEPFLAAWQQSGGRPAVVDVTTGQVVEVLDEPGYRMQVALLACALAGAAIPEDLKRFQPTSYYASTLHLLAISVVAERYPRCL